jgi:formate-dependent nitrite reductase cytochrome c552 subunit
MPKKKGHFWISIKMSSYSRAWAPNIPALQQVQQLCLSILSGSTPSTAIGKGIQKDHDILRAGLQNI